jgi:hypothetical protein
LLSNKLDRRIVHIIEEGVDCRTVFPRHFPAQDAVEDWYRRAVDHVGFRNVQRVNDASE